MVSGGFSLKELTADNPVLSTTWAIPVIIRDRAAYISKIKRLCKAYGNYG